MSGFKQRLAALVVGVLVTSSVGIIAAAESASAAVTPKTGAAGALDIAQAIASSSANLTGASFVSTTGGTPNGTADSSLGEFPTDSSTFGILTTGNVNSVPNPGTFANTGNGGGAVRGDTDRDVTVLKADVTVPPAANCLAFDFKFLSEEAPIFVGDIYNDAFIAEIDSSNWTTSGSTINAPNNFAFDSSGDVVSINSTGIGGLTAADGAGTAYDSSAPDSAHGEATGLLHAARQVTPGAHSVYFSIFDQGDNGFDSAVFLDNLVVGFVPNPSVNCAPGANPVNFNLDLTPQTATNPVGTSHTVTATLTDSAGAPIGGAPIEFTVAGANPGGSSEFTDEGGQASFTYTGNNAGTDQIGACYDANDESPCEAVASAAKTWTAPVGLDVDSEMQPTTVSAGDDVLDVATITATGGTAHDVSATVSSVSGGSAVSATVTQGSCDPPSGASVTCQIGDLAAGTPVTIRTLFTTPTTVPPGGTFSVTTTAHATEIAPAGVTSTATATETPKTPTEAGGFVSPGDTLTMGPTKATPANNTVSRFTLPNTGSGVAITLDALVSPPTFCGGTPCHGKIIELSPFEGGYTDPLNPAKLKIRYDSSVVTNGLTTQFYEQTAPDGPITLIPECAPRPGWSNFLRFISAVLSLYGFASNSGYASPAPCINSKYPTPDGDLVVEVLVLSGDPKIGFK